MSRWSDEGKAWFPESRVCRLNGTPSGKGGYVVEALRLYISDVLFGVTGSDILPAGRDGINKINPVPDNIHDCLDPSLLGGRI